MKTKRSYVNFDQGCTIEAKGFQAKIGQFDALNAQIVGVSVDSVEKHLDFEKSYGEGVVFSCCM